MNQVSKLNSVSKLIESVHPTDDILKRLGAFLLYTGLVDFMAIQAAKLSEQLIAKQYLENKKTVPFELHNDLFFYNAKISTNRIFFELKRILRFSSDINKDNADDINKLGAEMVKQGEKFLRLRNKLVHGIGDSRIQLSDWQACADSAIIRFRKFEIVQRKFFEAAAPFRLTAEQIKVCYQ